MEQKIDIGALEHIRKNGYHRISETDRANMDAYIERYRSFLTTSRTDRTTVANAIKLAEQNGFRSYVKNEELKPGDRVYYNNRGLALYLAVIGSESLAKGVNIVASHVDSPRLDVRPRPLVENDEIAFAETHYYGWVRKYQWMSLPLMLQGVVIKENGEMIVVSIGADEADPVFVISDLLPHIGSDQNKLPLNEAHAGEKMRVMLATIPLADGDGNKAVKLHVLKLLHERYGMCEEDFISADLAFVPALDVRDVGLDQSMLGAYGHDDRVCAYAALDALFDIKTPKKTALCVLADREEVGNNGVSGMRSATFDYFMEQLCSGEKVHRWECYVNSFCLSGDVTSAFDPNYAEMYAKEHSAKLNHGIALCKYTGFGGKEQASEASSTLLAHARTIFNKNDVLWQVAEIGRIDLGGGGTVALEMANRGIDTLDGGVPVLGMHSPFEVVAKLDCYMTRKAYFHLLDA